MHWISGRRFPEAKEWKSSLETKNVISNLVYSSENWTMSPRLKQKLEALEMWFNRTIIIFMKERNKQQGRQLKYQEKENRKTEPKFLG